MPSLLRTCLRYLFLFSVVFLSSTLSRASHIFGIDMYYSHVSGNTYQVHLVVYGDCSGGAFGSLSSSAPVIGVYDGGSFYTNMTLTVQAPASGVEVTPVCPAQASHTSCVSTSATLPGIKKFVYTGNITLPYTSAVWRFQFQSNMGGSYVAGRSLGITNVNFSTAGSPIQLVDTLNNGASDNSSAICTSIPTPFYCISTASNYNPAAVDPDGDHLVFTLVPAIDQSTGSSVNYIYPYNATSPLAVSSGSFTFNAATGQLAFTPNATQKSLVVYNIREFTSSGVLKGTSQREMTIVVLSPCTNNPPTGSITSATSGTIVNPTLLNVCNSVDTFNFQVNPTDPDGDSITMTTSGLPAGSTFTIVNNGSTAPHGTFAWNASTAAPGTYTFYITYQDNGCPLTSRQTIAYSITIQPAPSETVDVISPATCTRKALLHITPGSAYSPWMITVLAGSTTVHSFSGVTGMITDSLTPGTYTIRIYNPVFCYRDTTITIAAPALPSGIITITTPVCPGGTNGSITVSGTGGSTPYQYAIGSGSYSTSGTFTGLSAGTYAIHIKDANTCIKDTNIIVANPSAILENLFIRMPTCDTFSNGRVIINAYNSVAPYTFALGSGSYSSTDTFDNLAAGTYTFHIKNANGCIDDTTITLTDSLHLHGAITIAPVLCNGGTATVTVSGLSGFPAYNYAYGAGSFGSSGVFSITAGTYVFHIADVQSCHFDTTLTITQPNPIVITSTVHNVTCNGLANGWVAVSATGGTPGYQYAIDGGSYGTSSTLSGLVAGIHVVAVKDVNGCVYTDTVSVTQPTPINYDSLLLTMPACSAGGNGVIRIVASGGTPGYTYAINSGAYTSAATFTALPAATYVMHIKDANGCIKDSTVVLAQPPAITPIPTVTASLCSTLANGAVYLSASGGTPGYTYALGGGSYNATGIFLSMPAGTFIFHIKDANGCIKDTALTIVNALHISGSFAVTEPTCFGDTDGSFVVTGAGGTSPYTFAFGTGSFATTDTFTNLAAGSYSIHIEDSNGCIADTAFTLTQPARIMPLFTITQPSCFGLSDGSIVVNATGGTPGYTYSLNSGLFLTTGAYLGLAIGIDTITIKDTHGCLRDTVMTISQPMPLIVTNITGTNISCNKGADGTVTITGSGGTTPYQYAANTSPFQASNTLTGLVAGLNVIHIRDAHGCTIDTMIVLTQPDALVFTGATIVGPTCQGYADGAVTLLASGGTPPYTYSKDNVNFSSSSTISLLKEGTYTFYITDSKHCIADTTISLIGYPHINIDSVAIKGLSCIGNADGEVIIYPKGGVLPLSYSMTGNPAHPASNVFWHLDFGTYTITITDSANCTKDTTVVIPQPDTFNVFTVSTPNECIGNDNNGNIVTSVTGGTPPYSYLWSYDSSTNAGIFRVPNGMYTVYVHDVNNCRDSATTRVSYDDCCIPFIPSAFSPNNDGKNDEFRIKYKGDIRIIEFSVYNRFGEKIFLSEYSEKGWDGTYKGEPCDIGVYYYYVRLLCGNLHNNILEFKGDVTLMR